MAYFDLFAKAHSTNALHMLHDEIRRALVEEDALPASKPKPYGVREHGDFRAEADAIEQELRRRGERFQPLKW